MARQRDYRAEYLRRQQRSQARYGVSYNEYRKLQTRAKAAGIKPHVFRSQAFKEGTTQGDLGRIRRVLDTMQAARDETRALRKGDIPPTTSGRRDAADLYDAWSDSFDDDTWFFYH